MTDRTIDALCSAAMASMVLIALYAQGFAERAI